MWHPNPNGAHVGGLVAAAVVARVSLSAAPAAAPRDEPTAGAPDRGGSYYVAGGGHHPGVYKLSTKGVTLRQAVVAAGVDVKDGGRPVALIHLVGDGARQGFTLKEVLDDKAPPAARGGDVIEVGPPPAAN